MNLLVKREQPKRCPQLGLASDPFENAGRPDDDHRCYANLARERIDRGHQQRFCLSATYKRCPFLAVSARQEGLVDRARAWWRTVSPARPALAISQPGLRPWLGALAAYLVQVWQFLCAVVAVVLPVIIEGARALHARLTERSVRAAPLPAEERVEHTVIEEPPPALVAAAKHAAQGGDELSNWHAVLLTPPPQEDMVQRQDHVVVRQENLVAQGIAALEAGNEVDASQLFRRATEIDKQDARAWFWRAKTAETLDEVVKYLERAAALDPTNPQIASNLESAQQRQQALKARTSKQAASPDPGAVQVPPHLRAKRPRLRVFAPIADLGTAVCAFAAFLVGAAWLLSALPTELRQAINSSFNLPAVPDPTRLTSLVHFTLAGGYDVGSALPYGLGFLALFVGMGLLNRERWTVLWAPALAMITVWQIAG